MSKTGKWLLIFGIIAFVSAIAFGISVVTLGVRDGDYGINIYGYDIPVNVTDQIKISTGGLPMGKAEIKFRDNGTNIVYDFENDKEYSADFDAEGLSDIKLNLASCQANVVCGSSNKVSIRYKTGNRPLAFTAELKDGILQIDENITVSLFSLGSIRKSELSLEVPASMYNSLDLNLASGSITASGLDLDKLDANLASGSMDLSLHADSIKVNTASGTAAITNTTADPASSIDVNVASGSIDIKGYGADRTFAKLASGKITLDGISGEVQGEVMSGTLTLVYSEWNNSLDLQLASGKSDVTLPAGSGADIDYEHLSGKTEVDLDGNTVSLSKNSRVTVGGNNVQSVKIETASGKVNIHN